MHPIVFASRVEISGGLWTLKIGGSFQEGDPSVTKFSIEGRADIKELANKYLRLFFEDVKFTQRKIILTHQEKQKIADDYLKDNKLGDDDDDEEEKLANRQKESKFIQALIDEQENQVFKLPKLTLFMSRKKPKMRMIDIHKLGSRIFLHNDSKGHFGRQNTLGTFEASLKDIPDALSYKGLVVVKLPEEEPESNEPIVYGFIKFQSARGMKVKTSESLHLSDIAGTLTKLLDAKDRSKIRKITETIQPISFYTNLTKKGWVAFQKQPDDLVDYDLFLKIIDYCNVFLVNSQAHRIFKAVDVGGKGLIGMSEFENFLISYDVLEQASNDLIVLDVYDSLKMTAMAGFGEFGNHEGLDYSGFCEALQVLSIKEKTDEEIVEAFCFAGGIKEKLISTTFLTLTQFKKGWLKLADLENEVSKRGMKVDRGAMATSRNRERLLRTLNTQEEAYLESLSKVNGLVESVKSDRRMRREERRHEQEAVKLKLRHNMERFIAVRGQEKRLQVKKDQEDRSKKRLEQKVLRNQLMVRQQQQEMAEKGNIAEARQKAAKLRVEQVQALGLDRLDLSVKELRKIPTELFDSDEAQTKLAYLVVVNLSRNLLEELPEKNLFFWLTETKKLVLSQNRLVTLPDELENLAKLQFLEVHNNRLTALPNGTSQLTALRRLDVSNNSLSTFPDGIGCCGSLEYLAAHTNKLTTLPQSLGGCFELQFLDLSRNKLCDLPESMDQLASLTHLDVNTNTLGHLPSRIGLCHKLNMLDVSNNYITYLPETFSSLKQLEICQLHSNLLVLHPNRFNSLHKLKKLTIHNNQCKSLYTDIRGMNLLELFTAGHNEISFIPPEIGLLTTLQELNLERNALHTLPPELGACSQLRLLDVSFNRLTGCFPETIGLIRSLQHLTLSHNAINIIPKSIVALTKLRSLVATDCLIAELPDNFTNLRNLQALDFNSNKFTLLPLQIFHLTSLRTVSFANNLLQLLPKCISQLTFLDSLDLSRNQLRALPIEFIPVLECVPSVGLLGNSWADYPPKWSSSPQFTMSGNSNHDPAHRSTAHSSNALGELESTGPQLGYSTADAINFLYCMSVFYNDAEALWKTTGALHYTNRLSFQDFVQDLKTRLPHSYHNGLTEYVKYIYFKSRESGIFPRWYCCPEDLVTENKLLQENDNQRRRDNVLRAKEEQRSKEQSMLYAYGETIDGHHLNDAGDKKSWFEGVQKELKYRSDLKESLREEHRQMERFVQEVSLVKLQDKMEEAEKKIMKKRHFREATLAAAAQEETARLKGKVAENLKKYQDRVSEAEGRSG